MICCPAIEIIPQAYSAFTRFHASILSRKVTVSRIYRGHQMEEREHGGEEGRDEDVRKEIEDTFHDKQIHELAEFPLLCSFVDLNRLPYKLDDNKYAHHCSMNKLSGARNLFPTGRESPH